MPLSLFAFRAHLKQEYLQIFFSTQYLEGQSVYLKAQDYPQATQPLRFLKLKLVLVFDFWFL